jgi:hypothetical protein
MKTHVSLLLSLFALRASAEPGPPARDVVRDALESQATLPDDPPQLPTAGSSPATGAKRREQQGLNRARVDVPAASTNSHADAARRVADQAAGGSSSAQDKVSSAPGQVRAADVRAYGNVKKTGNSAAVGKGSGKGNSGNSGNGNGNGNGKGNGKGKNGP